MGATVLITGSTGFLGKVVLHELIRRKEELGVDRCVLLIRGKRKHSARKRFEAQMAPSACFAELPFGWTRLVDVVEGDLSMPRCGINDLVWRRLQHQVTHVIHCAASVDFDLPVADACSANITSSLNMLQLGQDMAKLQAFVSTSTAYVTPHKKGVIAEELAPLPRPAAALLADIHGGVDEAQLMAETGHANTYTYTKCLAEHLQVQHRGSVPLTIVRPSIISASMAQPTPGWIDSKAAFAGFVVTIGGGLLKVVDADPSVHLDIVPVDHVVDVLIGAAFAPRPAAPAVPILHAVAGTQHAAHIGTTSAAIVTFFRRHRVARKPRLAHLGRRSLLFSAREAVHHTVPAAVAQALTTLRGDARGTKRVRRLSQTLRTINKVFPYFTHHTFNFATGHPLPQHFNIQAYVDTVCRGALTHLMRKDRHQLVVAGREHKSPKALGLSRLLAAKHTLWLQAALSMAQALCARLFDAVTFDEPAFRRALARVPKGHQLVLVPTHRSYLDFVLLPYLLAVRDDLQLPQPCIVAADDFLRLPILGPILKRFDAMAMPRAHSGAAIDVAPILRRVADGRPLMVFLEGERSRGRKALPLRTDVLQALQQADRPLALLPVGISYERIAEETPFLRELKEGLRTPLNARDIFTWLRRAQRNKVHLGRVHLTADRPVLMTAESDAHAVAARVQRGLRRATVCTDFHLRTFVRRHPRAAIDVPTLREALIARGGQVLRSSLRDSRTLQLDARLEAGTRKQWAALFAWDLAAHYPHAHVLKQLLQPELEGVPMAPGAQHVPVDEPHLHGLLEALARPIVEDCLAVAQALCAVGDAHPGPHADEKVGSISESTLLSQTTLHDSTALPDVLAVLSRAKLIAYSGPQRLARIELLPASDAAWAAFRAGCDLTPRAAAQPSQPKVRTVGRGSASGARP